ncbi:3-oxo-5-alpha-steroid 4-dehydrogenase 1 [Pseudohyphozyma bogoriensis]|nr:3-oxo-5-alpha-steroid 4-dehydrogenase 1 [Pseudohyphozyma bogoriensis]
MIMFEDYTKALCLEYGTVGLYGLFLRLFALFAILAGSLSVVIDAPFGRFSSKFGPIAISVNGNVAWLLMEIVSPLAFTAALVRPLSTTPQPLSFPTFPQLHSTLSYLPKARLLLSGLFLLHYANRAVVSTLRNPGRSEMGLIVPVLAAFFNVVNGTLQGEFIGGGFTKDTRTTAAAKWSDFHSWGVQNGRESLFFIGIALFITGFILNILHDEILYSIRRSGPPAASKSQRYGIPHGLLYSHPFSGVSHPAYTSEWLEWSGYLLATLALSPAPFPQLVLQQATGKGKSWVPSLFKASLLKKVPRDLWPLEGWYLQPPALFLVNEVAAMLPRAISGHKWYQKTFGKDWPASRKVVIPGLL